MGECPTATSQGTGRTIPRGKPKSGRVWRSPGKKKSTLLLSSLKCSWKKHQRDRNERKVMKEFERELKETAANAKEERRKRIEERRKQKLENEMKSEVVQKITNPAKLKRMKKKQLRKIRKR